MIRARRVLLAAVVGYVLLDLCSPFVPGAFSFDAQLSVDGLGGARVRQATPPRTEAVVSAVLRVAPLPPLPPRPAARMKAPRVWWPHLARDQAVVAADPRPAADDH